MVEKIDSKKTLDAYRAKYGEFRVVDVPTMQYLIVDGQGDPNSSSEYAQALEALYPVACKMKCMSKRQLRRDYAVPPLGGPWWADDVIAAASYTSKSKWQWTAMIVAPTPTRELWFRKTAPENLWALLRQSVRPMWLRRQRYCDHATSCRVHMIFMAFLIRIIVFWFVLC